MVLKCTASSLRIRCSACFCRRNLGICSCVALCFVILVEKAVNLANETEVEPIFWQQQVWKKLLRLQFVPLLYDRGQRLSLLQNTTLRWTHSKNSPEGKITCIYLYNSDERFLARIYESKRRGEVTSQLPSHNPISRRCKTTFIAFDRHYLQH